MQEKSILKAAIVVAIVGLSFLFVYADNFNLTTVGSLDLIEFEESVHLRGKINSLRVTEKAIFLKVEGEQIVNTDVILFPEGDLYLKEGDLIEIFGEVEEYNGGKEVIGSKVLLK